MKQNDSEPIRPFINDRLFMRAALRGESDAIEKVDCSLYNSPGVYCIFNSESKMLYIGCSNNVSDRITTHRRHLSNGEHICKIMNADYLKNPSVFRFFCIEYLQDDYESYEAQRSSLLNRETQYMKRVPHTQLYNNAIPVSMSERLLSIECPAKDVRIPITELCRNLDMSPDSIRANGFKVTDDLSLSGAIEFVRKRTVANGRWPADKAERAIEYLSELEQIKAKSKPADPAAAGKLLMAGGQMDYFGELVISKELVPHKRVQRPANADWLLDAINYVEIGGALAGFYLLFGWIGALPGLICAAFYAHSMAVLKRPGAWESALLARGVCFIIAAVFGWVHFQTLAWALSEYRPDIGGAFWVALSGAALLSGISLMALYQSQNVKTDKQ